MFYYLILFFILVFIIERCKRRDFVQLHKQIGNYWTYIPVIGHAYVCLRSNEAMYRLLIKVQRDIKERLICIWLGNTFLFGVGDITQANTVMKLALDKTIVTQFIASDIGNGSAFSPDVISRQRRKDHAVTFAPRNVISFLTIFKANAGDIAEQLELKVGKGNFSVWDHISLYSLETVCESIFGVKMGVLKQPNHPFALAFNEYFEIIGNRLFAPWLHPEAIFRLFPVYKRRNRAKKVMFDFVDNMINLINLKEESQINGDEQEKNSTNYMTFLQMMIRNSKESKKYYTNEELREESLLLLLAATDTSATGLCFILLVLSQHQDVQQKVFEELQTVFGDTDNPIDYANLAKLSYLDAVIKETLRLYPPVPLLCRDSDKEIILEPGLTIPKNCNTLISIAGIHRDPNYWGDDVDEFKPDRFLSRKTSLDNAYIPFAAGPRRCPGQLYAMLSMKTTIVIILRRYRVLPSTSFIYNKDNPLRINFSFMSKHADNFDIQIEHRNKSTKL